MASGLTRTITAIFDAETSGFTSGLQRVSRSMEATARDAENLSEEIADIKGPEIEPRLASIRQLRADYERQIDAIFATLDDPELRADLDTNQAFEDIRKLQRNVRELDRMDIDIDVDVDRDGRLSKGLGRISGGLSDMTAEIPVLGAALARLPPQAQLAAAGVAAAVATVTAATAGLAVVGGGGAALVGGGFFALLDSYAELESAAKRTRIVLGDQADDVREWAREVDASFGVASEALVQSVAATADLLKPQGFATDDAAKYAKELNSIADALAKWGGTDFETALEAVSAGVLGEREQLKQYGVVISQSQVDARAELLKTKDAYRDYNEEQLASVATVELIQEKSSDALKAQKEGAEDATRTLSGLKSVLEGLKFEGLAGFGEILAQVVSDIGSASTAIGGLSEAPDNLRKWIKNNSDEIRSFFLDLSEWALAGAEAFVSFGAAVLDMAAAVAPQLENLFQGFLTTSAVVVENIGLLLKTNPVTYGLGEDLQRQAAAARGMADAMEGWGDKAASGARAAAQGLRDFRDQQLLPTKKAVQDLQKAQDLLSGARSGDRSWASLRRELESMSSGQLLALQVAIPDDSKNKAERELEDLARRREAQILAEGMGIDLTEKQLKELSRDRDATIRAKLKGLDKAKRDLEDAARTRNATIRLSAGGDGTTVIRNKRGQLVPVVGGRLAWP